MTIVIADNSPRKTYTATAGQTDFPTDFAFFSKPDVNVYVDNVLKTLDSDYSIPTTGPSAWTSGNDGTIVFSTGLTVGQTVVLTRDVELERTTDFPTSGPFQVSSLNVELDKLVAMVADMKDLADRGLRLSDSDISAALVLADKDARKGTVLAFNATTGAVEVGPTIADTNTIAQIKADVATVAGISGNVTTVAGISSNVTTVASNNANVTTVAGQTANMQSVVDNLTDIQNAVTSATNAAASATAAATSATNASTSETNAATSESNASTSATNASTLLQVQPLQVLLRLLQVLLLLLQVKRLPAQAKLMQLRRLQMLLIPPLRLQHLLLLHLHLPAIQLHLLAMPLRRQQTLRHQLLPPLPRKVMQLQVKQRLKIARHLLHLT